MPNPLPQVNALLLCERAYQHHQTGRWTVSGSFSFLWFPTLPATYAPLVAFVSLNDFPGGEVVQLTVRDMNGVHVVSIRSHIPVLPRSHLDLAFGFPPVTFREAGAYSIELHTGGELLSVRSFHVLVKELPEGGGTMSFQPEEQPPY